MRYSKELQDLVRDLRAVAGADDYRPTSPPQRTYTDGEVRAATAAAYDYVIVHNALTRPGGYSPYCMRCRGFVRMRQVGLLQWSHDCGAKHDEAPAREALLKYQEEQRADGT